MSRLALLSFFHHGRLCPRQLQGGDNRVAKRLKIGRSIMADTIDEKGWSTVHAAADSPLQVRRNAIVKKLFSYCFLPNNAVQTQKQYRLEQTSGAQILLCFKEAVVHFPKHSFRTRKLGGFGGRQCKGMYLLQGKVS